MEIEVSAGKQKICISPFFYKKMRLPKQKQKNEGLSNNPLLYRSFLLASGLGDIYRTCTSKEQAFKKLDLWYNEVVASAIDSFKTMARSIQTHYLDILNFFIHRSTNASAESFNAKIKAFRATQRGVRDVEFFLFRLSKIYA